MYQERPVMAMNAAALNGIKNSNQNGKIEFTSGFKIIFFYTGLLCDDICINWSGGHF